jgi:hypothetical protein
VVQVPPTSVHEDGVNVALKVSVKLTVPVGAAPPALSTTVAVQVVAVSTSMLVSVQVSEVVLARWPVLKSARKFRSEVGPTAHSPPTKANSRPELYTLLRLPSICPLAVLLTKKPYCVPGVRVTFG